MDEGQAPGERGAPGATAGVDDLEVGAYGTETVEAYRARLERNYRTSLKCWWSRDFGFISILDPFTGEVIEVERTADTPRWMTWRAMDEKARRKRYVSSVTSPAWPGRGSTD